MIEETEDRDLRSELRDLDVAIGAEAFRWIANDAGYRVSTVRQWSENRMITKSDRRSVAIALSRAREHFGLGDDAPHINGADSNVNGRDGNADGHGDMPIDAGEEARAAKAAAAPRMKWETIDEILNSPDREYLIDGLLAKGEMSLWVGASKVGKTHLLLHIAYQLAVGAPKIVGRTAQGAVVLYVTGEGGAGLKRRVRALKKCCGNTSNLVIHRRSFDLRRDRAAVMEIIAKAKEVGAAFIVIDTVNRALAGGEENSSKDMGELVRNVDFIREETGAHIALIHHMPHERAGSRGHSSLPAACDLVMSVSADKGTGVRRATVVEARDICEGAVFPYRLIQVECEADENGPALTATTIECLPEEETDRSSAAQGRSTRGRPDKGAPPMRATDATRAMKLLRERIDESGKPVPDGIAAPPGAIGIPENEFRAAYSGQRSDANPNAVRKAYGRAMDALEATDGVRRGDGWLWIDPGVTA